MITREKYIARAEKLFQDGIIDSEKFNAMMDQIDYFTEPAINVVDVVIDLVKFIEFTDPYGFDDYFENMSHSEIIEAYIDYLANDKAKTEEVIAKIEEIIKEADGDEDIILDGYALIRDLKEIIEL